MSLTRRLRLVLPLVALACCALSLPIACSISGPDAHYYYPTGLEAGAEQLYAWPANGTDEFRFYVQDPGSALGDSHAQAETLHASRDRMRIEALAAKAGSLTFLLSEDADASTRKAARDLIDQLSSACPGLSTHCVPIKSDVRSIQSGEDLGQTLKRAGAFHEESRPAGLGVSFMGAMGRLWTMTETPNFVVLPLASGTDRFAVYGDLRLKGDSASSVECGLDEIAGILEPGLHDPEARKLMGSWGSVDGGGRTTVSCGSTGNVFVAVYLPEGIPAGRRAQCASLAAKLCSDEFAPIVVAQADANWSWSACTDGEYLRKHLPLDGDKSFITGSVRQSAVLPKPEK